MGVAFYWAHNDGMSGHVWLSESDLRALADEMLVQGMPWPADRIAAGGRISVAEIEGMLAPAVEQPRVVADEKLWLDWLRFLEGAAVNGGLLVRR
jgi:hypothetical protein